jgi:EAL domain-containing protein (putative c-di-GMP-specific phosphodiesterase class I)
MNKFKDKINQFSLDDISNSCLKYIGRLPRCQLKINQSIVHGIAFDDNAKTFVRNIIAIARSMGMEVIAEGVETEEQRQFLQNIGCNHFQGYLFGSPVPIEQFDALLKLG